MRHVLPVGPWLVTSDEVGDAQHLGLWLDLNGVRRQESSTADMIFSIDSIVSYVSHFMTLNPGDIIVTGTPAGVGMGSIPPVFLEDGDVLELGVDRLGQQKQQVRRKI